MALYVKVFWDHETEFDPVVMYSEIGDDRYESRKIYIFRDGSSEWTDGATEMDRTFLGEVPFPEFEEIEEQKEFKLTEISRDDFEDLWREVAKD